MGDLPFPEQKQRRSGLIKHGEHKGVGGGTERRGGRDNCGQDVKYTNKFTLKKDKINKTLNIQVLNGEDGIKN